MNAGGVATVLHQPLAQTSLPNTAKNTEVMTCDGEATGGMPARLAGSRAGRSIEIMKQLAEQARVRQDKALPFLITQQRKEQEKYRKKYLDAENKRLAEQNAKSNQEKSAMGHHTVCPAGPSLNRFAAAPGSMLPFIPGGPIRYNNRKRPPCEPAGVPGWPQVVCPQMAAMAGVQAGFPPHRAPFMHPVQARCLAEMPIPAHPSALYPGHCNLNGAMRMRPAGAPEANGPMQCVADMKLLLPASCNAETTSKSFPSELHNMYSLPDFANESSVLGIESGLHELRGGLHELGPDCLVDVLPSQGEDSQQPSTSHTAGTVSTDADAIDSPGSHPITPTTSSSMVSPVSLNAHTPNDGPPSAHSLSMRSTNSSTCSATTAEPTTPHQMNGSAVQSGVFPETPVDVPLCSSTPSSTSSCCHSHIASTSGGSGGCAPSGRPPMAPSLYKGTLPGCSTSSLTTSAAVVPPQAYPGGEPMQPSTEHVHPQHFMPPLRQQLHITPTSHFSYTMEADQGALMRMQQRFNDPSGAAAGLRYSGGISRASLSVRPTYAQPLAYDMHMRATPVSSFATLPGQHLQQQQQPPPQSASYAIPIGAEQMQQRVTAAGEQMFSSGDYPSSTQVARGRQVTYGYAVGMQPMSQHQMAMYHQVGGPAGVQRQYAPPPGYMQTSQPYFPGAGGTPFPYPS